MYNIIGHTAAHTQCKCTHREVDIEQKYILRDAIYTIHSWSTHAKHDTLVDLALQLEGSYVQDNLKLIE